MYSQPRTTNSICLKGLYNLHSCDPSDLQPSTRVSKNLNTFRENKEPEGEPQMRGPALWDGQTGSRSKRYTVGVSV